MKKNHKCYIYTRVSTAIQVDGYSLDAQKDKLRKYAEYQDMPIVSEFSDAITTHLIQRHYPRKALFQGLSGFSPSFPSHKS